MINTKEFEALIKTESKKRYEYFIKRIVDFEEVWSLADTEGFALTKDDNGRLLAPFWPAQEYAEYCAIGEWKEYKPEKIEFDEFMSEWLPGLKNDNIGISIFFNNIDSITLPINKLIEDLNLELEDY